jgi:hypothetical protein
MAQAIRAILLANATAATFVCLRAAIPGKDYEYSGFDEPEFTKKKEDGWCKKYSQICGRINQIKKNLMRLSSGIAHTSHTKEKSIVNYHMSIALQEIQTQYGIFRMRLNGSWGFLKKRNIQAIVLGQPVLWKESLEPDESNSLWFSINTINGHVRTSGAWLKEEMAKYNSVQELLAQQSGFLYLDLDARIPKTLTHYFDDYHFTDIGSKAVAINILPALIETIDNNSQ